MPATGRARVERDRAAATDALMTVSRLMTGVVARTLAGVEEQVTVPQFRVLVMLWVSGPLTIGDIAEELAVNPSNASRTCDRLISSELAVRRVNDEDRRSVLIELTPAGRQLIENLMDQRRAILDEIVGALGPAAQRHLAKGLTALIDEVEMSGHADRVGLKPGTLAPWIL